VDTALTGIEKSKPDLVVVDITLADSNGIDLVKNLRAQESEIPMLMLSMHDESLYAERALRAGANGFVMKQEANKTIRDAIRKVLGGEIYLSEKMSSKMVSKFVGGRPQQAPSPLESLSQRELEVFRMIGQGYSTRQIADDLKLTVPTINSFRARIKDKLQLANANELALAAIQWVQNKSVPTK
jgi:DNA-binding NarL/FixJ family response regulator